MAAEPLVKVECALEDLVDIATYRQPTVDHAGRRYVVYPDPGFHGVEISAPSAGPCAPWSIIRSTSNELRMHKGELNPDFIAGPALSHFRNGAELLRYVIKMIADFERKHRPRPNICNQPEDPEDFVKYNYQWTAVEVRQYRLNRGVWTHQRLSPFFDPRVELPWVIDHLREFVVR